MFKRQRTVARRRLDERLVPFKASDLGTIPSGGWVRAIREALGMTAVQFARRMGVKPPSVSGMERSEVHGTIQLKTLRKAAEALDCVLVYALVPRTSLEASVQARARALADEEMGRVGHTMDLEAQGLSKAEREAQIEDYIRDHLRESELWNTR